MRSRRNSLLILLAVSGTVILFIVFHGRWTASDTKVSSNSGLKVLVDSKLRANVESRRNVPNQHDTAGHSHRNRLSRNSAATTYTSKNDQREAAPADNADCDKYRKVGCDCENRTDNSMGQLSRHNEISTKYSGRRGGYMLSFRYYEQQTQGIRNLLQMQCLADSFGMKIVEPFIVRSQFVIPIFNASGTENLTKKYLGLSDLVDMKRWNTETHINFGYTAVSTWEEFLLKAPRNIIAHCIKYRNPPKIQVPIPGYHYQHGCPKQCFDKFTKSMEYLGAFGFQLVQKTCSNFIDYAGSVMPEEFMENVMGKYSPNEVTLVVNEFRGFFGFYRLPVLSECGITHNKVNISTLPSSRIRTDAHKYSQLVFKGRPYAAVIARIERIILHLHQNVSECSREIIKLLWDLRSSHDIADTFLAMDVGRFGSSGSARNNFQPYGETLFKSIYGNRWSFDEWESSFESIASSDNPAYVANLQRTIAATSKCLILFGGGGFQSMARNLYERFHPDPNSWCIYKVCNREV